MDAGDQARHWSSQERVGRKRSQKTMREVRKLEVGEGRGGLRFGGGKGLICYWERVRALAITWQCRIVGPSNDRNQSTGFHLGEKRLS
jgi:hypothetical protein